MSFKDKSPVETEMKDMTPSSSFSVMPRDEKDAFGGPAGDAFRATSSRATASTRAPVLGPASPPIETKEALSPIGTAAGDIKEEKRPALHEAALAGAPDRVRALIAAHSAA